MDKKVFHRVLVIKYEYDDYELDEKHIESHYVKDYNEVISWFQDLLFQNKMFDVKYHPNCRLHPKIQISEEFISHKKFVKLFKD